MARMDATASTRRGGTGAATGGGAAAAGTAATAPAMTAVAAASTSGASPAHRERKNSSVHDACAEAWRAEMCTHGQA